MISHLCSLKRTLYIVYGEQCRTAVFKNICFVQCTHSSARQLFSKIYVIYSVQRVMHDSCIQEYMLCTLYAEQCTKSVFKNICYARCMQSSVRHLYSRICYVHCTVYEEQCTTSVFKNTRYVQCMQSSAGQLYLRIHVMYSVCRVVQDSCIQEYMLCTVYGEKCTTTALFKNIWYVHFTVSVRRVVQDSGIQEYILCTVYEEQYTTAVFKNIFMAGNEFTRNLPLLGYTHAQNIYIIMECTDTHSDTQT